MTVFIDLKQLYESSYLQWLEETINCLKSRQLAENEVQKLILKLYSKGV